MKDFLLLHKEFLIGLLLSVSLLWPLLASPFFTHHDDVQIIRLFEMDKCFKDLQIPCRWVPDLGGLYGYPIFNYYAPLPYYFGEIFYLLTSSLLVSVKIMFAVPFIGSFLFMYLLGRRLWGELGGILSGIFYSFAPYHAVILYVRGAMGELWGLMLFPAIIWSTLRLYQTPRVYNALLTTVFTALLIISHNLSAMLFLPFSCLLILVFFLWTKNTKFLKLAVLSVTLALLIAAFYWIPMVFEKQLVHVDSTTWGYFSYTEHFKGIRKLFLERSWGWGASVREVPGGERDGMSFQIGWVHLLGWIISMIAAKRLWLKNRWISWTIILATSAVILSIFMVHPRSEFVWKFIGPLKFIQFPWRFLGLIIFFISLTAGSCLLLLNQQKRKLFWYALVIAVVSLNFLYFRPEKFLEVTDQQLLQGANWERQIKRSIFDYLPIYAKEPPAELAQSRYQILAGDVSIADYHEGSNWITFQANVQSHSIIRLSQYYFPDWRIKINGNESKIDYENNLGLMTFILGKGEYKVEARLYDTKIRILSNWITALGLFMLIFLLLTQFKPIRNWIAYYLKALHR